MKTMLTPSGTSAAPTVSGEDKRRLLEARAAALARIPDELPPSMEGMDLVIFALAGERYAVEAAHVREVCPAICMTPVPCTPRFVAGVINVRGDIIAVIDLKVLFEEAAASGKVGEVILVEVGESLFGILVDQSLGVAFIPASDLEEVFPVKSGTREAFLKGCTADRMFVLDMKRIVEEGKLLIHEEVTI